MEPTPGLSHGKIQSREKNHRTVYLSSSWATKSFIPLDGFKKR